MQLNGLGSDLGSAYVIRNPGDNSVNISVPYIAQNLITVASPSGMLWQINVRKDSLNLPNNGVINTHEGAKV